MGREVAPISHGTATARGVEQGAEEAAKNMTSEKMNHIMPLAERAINLFVVHALEAFD